MRTPTSGTPSTRPKPRNLPVRHYQRAFPWCYVTPFSVVFCCEISEFFSCAYPRSFPFCMSAASRLGSALWRMCVWFLSLSPSLLSPCRAGAYLPLEPVDTNPKPYSRPTTTLARLLLPSRSTFRTPRPSAPVHSPPCTSTSRATLSAWAWPPPWTPSAPRPTAPATRSRCAGTLAHILKQVVLACVRTQSYLVLLHLCAKWAGAASRVCIVNAPSRTQEGVHSVRMEIPASIMGEALEHEHC